MSDQHNSAVAAPRPAPPKPTGSGDTVTVGCKLPNGFVIQTFQMEPVYEPVLGGGQRETTRARKVGEDYVLNGHAISPLEAMKGNLPTHLIVGGYGLTPGIPRDVWEKWYEDNKTSALVQNRIVFMHSTEAGARSMALEQTAVPSGLEPLDPENPGARSPDFRRIRRGTRENSDADNL